MKYYLALISLLHALPSWAQENRYSRDTALLQPLEITAVRAADRTPVAKTNLSRKEIEKNNPYGQTVIFNSHSEKVNTHNLPILHLSQSQFFNGTLFVFDLASVILTEKFPNVKKRILYTNSTPWSNSPATKYEEWKSLYEQESLDILTNSVDLYDIYNICWKKPLGISERFNYEEISKFI